MNHLHVVQGLSPRETGRALGISTAAVYLAKHRVGRLLKREIRRVESGSLSPVRGVEFRREWAISKRSRTVHSKSGFCKLRSDGSRISLRSGNEVRASSTTRSWRRHASAV